MDNNLFRRWTKQTAGARAYDDVMREKQEEKYKKEKEDTNWKQDVLYELNTLAADHEQLEHNMLERMSQTKKELLSAMPKGIDEDVLQEIEATCQKLQNALVAAHQSETAKIENLIKDQFDPEKRFSKEELQEQFDRAQEQLDKQKRILSRTNKAIVSILIISVITMIVVVMSFVSNFIMIF